MQVIFSVYGNALHFTHEPMLSVKEIGVLYFSLFGCHFDIIYIYRTLNRLG
jgi:hypothetical protein